MMKNTSIFMIINITNISPGSLKLVKFAYLSSGPILDTEQRTNQGNTKQ